VSEEQRRVAAHAVAEQHRALGAPRVERRGQGVAQAVHVEAGGVGRKRRGGAVAGELERVDVAAYLAGERRVERSELGSGAERTVEQDERRGGRGRVGHGRQEIGRGSSRGNPGSVPAVQAAMPVPSRRVRRLLVLVSGVAGWTGGIDRLVAQPVARPTRPPSPAADRALALPGVRWVRRTTPNADLFVQAGSAAEQIIDGLPEAAEQAIAADRAWLGLPADGARVRLFFVGSREAMRPLVGWTPGGYAAVEEGTAFFVAAPEVRPALRHEIMHLLSWRHWGTPGGLWLSEGVATRAAGGCGGLTVDEVAAVLLRERALPPLDTLRRAFDVRGRTGAAQYLAAASLVGYVEQAHGRAALRALWAGGLRRAEAAIGTSPAALERGWRAAVARRGAPALSWAELWSAIAARGCE
jgi:hypothetical protein